MVYYCLIFVPTLCALQYVLCYRLIVACAGCCMLHYDCYLSVLFVQSCAIRACVSFLVYVVCIACFSCAVSCSVFICLYHNMLLVLFSMCCGPMVCCFL